MPIYKNVARVVYFTSLTVAGAANTATVPTMTIVQNNGAQGSTTNVPTHKGGGQWALALTAAEMNAAEVAIGHSAAACVPGTLTIYPEADYPGAILAAVIETNGGVTLTVQQALQLAASMPAGTIAGILAGAGTQAFTLKSATGKALATVTGDELGNRTVVWTTP